MVWICAGPAGMVRLMHGEHARPRDWLFWIMTVGLALYVAICTPRRDNHIEADAWEHHRAILELSISLWRPSNPTLATDDPSIRFSPYSVMLAWLSRATGIDAFDIQSGAAILNTLLLCFGVRALLAAFRRREAAGLALLIMVGLYGMVPAYANSYALADLPWHQVNPSAWVLGLILFAWAIFLRTVNGRLSPAAYIAIVPLMAAAMLDHAMTGFMGFLALGAFSIALPGDRPRRVVIVGLIAAASASLCLLWPWYSFYHAIVNPPEADYSFNPTMLRLAVLTWAAPAIVLSLWSLTASDRTTVRALLTAGGLCLALGVSSFLTKSALTARLPLPGMIFFHLAIAVAAEESGLLSLPVWRERLRELVFSQRASAQTVLVTIAAAALLYFLLPQLQIIASTPYLARAYIAPLAGHPDRQLNLRATYARLLAPIAPRDVVLADLSTAWPVPSFGGRIVAPVHKEYFVNGQDKRAADVRAFFAEATGQERAEILDRYHVRWILLNLSEPSRDRQAGLLRDHAVVGRENSFVLMDAAKWRSGP
jgi:hypothetical protein